jgi:hypothetical protein
MRLALVLSLVCVSGACACTIPVFRYALDRWEADKFHLILPASASQDTALQDVLRPLRANGKANMDITTARDAAVTAAELRFSRESDRLVWTGALDKASLAALLDSPVRQKILKSILDGDSFVWVIADSGSAQDAAEVERIEKRLRFLEQVASLPIQDPNDPDSQLGPGPPLKLKFTTLRLRRDDAEEKLLLKMLAGPKSDIDPATTSFAAAVFGKGRVLGAWPLAQLDDTALEDASMFLVGRCGCRIKNENPGWDLLLDVDWSSALEKAGAPTAQNVAEPPKTRQPETVTVTPAAAAPPEKARAWPWVAAGGAIVLVAAVVFVLSKTGAARR